MDKEYLHTASLLSKAPKKTHNQTRKTAMKQKYCFTQTVLEWEEALGVLKAAEHASQGRSRWDKFSPLSPATLMGGDPYLRSVTKTSRNASDASRRAGYVLDICNCECFQLGLAGQRAFYTDRGWSRTGTTEKKISPYKPSELSLATYQSQTQLISQFLDDYLPPKTSTSMTYQSAVYWVETFSNFLDSQSAIVKTSLSALTLMHISKSQQDNTLEHCSRHSYSLVTQQILGLRQLRDPTDLIRAGMILALYETYNSQDKAWEVHVGAACNLMQQSHSPAKALNDHDLRRLCTINLLRVCIDGPTTPPPILHLRTRSSADIFDQLLEVLFKVIKLLWDLRQKKEIGDLDWTSAGNMLRMSMHHESQLLNWYHGLQSENDHPLFMAKASPSLSTPVTADDHQIIIFTNPSSIPLLLLYWLGLVAVYASMFEALETLAHLGQCQPPDYLQQRMEATDALCRHFVARISQSQTGAAAGKGLGTAILAAATSLAAQKISSRWERDVSGAALEM